MNLKEIKLANQHINDWKAIRMNKQEGYKLLSSGSGIRISEENFNKWSSQSKYIYLYIGCIKCKYNEHEWDKNEIVFYLIDDIADKKKDYSSLIMKKFVLQPSKGESTKINKFTGDSSNNEFKAIVPIFRWLLYGHRWFHDQAPLQTVRVFRIPYNDFKVYFNPKSPTTSKVDHVFLTFALKNEARNNQIDIFVFRHNHADYNQNIFKFIKNHPAQDTTMPFPPYNSSIKEDYFSWLVPND